MVTAQPPVRLPARLGRQGLEISEWMPLGHVHSRAFRIRTADGRHGKVRLVKSGERARVLMAWLRACSDDPATRGLLPEPWVSVGRAMVVEWIEGEPLAPARGAPLIPSAGSRGVARRVGAVLARLHTLGAEALPRQAPAASARPVPMAELRRQRTRFVRRVRRAGLLSTSDADRLERDRGPDQPRFALTHGDARPDNLVQRSEHSLCLIDEERLAVRPAAFDLARVVALWPLGERDEALFLAGYGADLAAAQDFVAHRRFWLALAHATNGLYHWVYDRAAVPAILDAMRAL